MRKAVHNLSKSINIKALKGYQQLFGASVVEAMLSITWDEQRVSTSDLVVGGMFVFLGAPTLSLDSARFS
jgi:hypothetical protein